MLRDFWSRLRWNLCAPEYIFRPAQLLRRARRRFAPHPPEVCRLPWGLDLRLSPGEMISRSIARKGIYDLVLTETVWRLLDEGEFALDVGAHLGYVTSLMAARVGGRGKVIGIEPHPDLFQELSRNAARWKGAPKSAEVVVLNVAASDVTGAGYLRIPPDWELNRGVASVLAQNQDLDESDRKCAVRRERLDSLLDANSRVGVAKLDVEGHEDAVLRGAEGFLGRGAIRDIVFEDFGRYPTAAMLLLEGFGYKVFSLAKALWGPRLAPADRSGVARWNDPNYLATLDPTRAIARLGKRGWAVLKSR